MITMKAKKVECGCQYCGYNYAIQEYSYDAQNFTIPQHIDSKKCIYCKALLYARISPEKL
jgi:tRNA(Ile)-lysidine synthase TilS/MesJ